MNTLRVTVKYNKGLSLIELIITLALLSVTLALGNVLFTAATNIFTLAEKRSTIQQGVRVAGDFITQKVRYADQLEIIDASIPANFSNTSYYYIYQTGSTIQYRTPGEHTGRSISGGIFADLQFDLLFSKGTNNRILNFSVQASKMDAEAYSISSEVLCLNLTTITGIDSNRAIRFRKPL